MAASVEKQHLPEPSASQPVTSQCNLPCLGNRSQASPPLTSCDIGVVADPPIPLGDSTVYTPGKLAGDVIFS